jgi:hypothetical protein
VCRFEESNRDNWSHQFKSLDSWEDSIKSNQPIKGSLVVAILGICEILCDGIQPTNGTTKAGNIENRLGEMRDVSEILKESRGRGVANRVWR